MFVKVYTAWCMILAAMAVPAILIRFSDLFHVWFVGVVGQAAAPILGFAWGIAVVATVMASLVFAGANLLCQSMGRCQSAAG
jgi:membrane protein implicated in regulation of membrane protease activity